MRLLDKAEEYSPEKIAIYVKERRRQMWKRNRLLIPKRGQNSPNGEKLTRLLEKYRLRTNLQRERVKQRSEILKFKEITYENLAENTGEIDIFKIS